MRFALLRARVECRECTHCSTLAAPINQLCLREEVRDLCLEWFPITGLSLAALWLRRRPGRHCYFSPSTAGRNSLYDERAQLFDPRRKRGTTFFSLQPLVSTRTKAVQLIVADEIVVVFLVVVVGLFWLWFVF